MIIKKYWLQFNDKNPKIISITYYCINLINFATFPPFNSFRNYYRVFSEFIHLALHSIFLEIVFSDNALHRNHCTKLE